jgi:nucleoside-diphosphate-sugar epimerase
LNSSILISGSTGFVGKHLTAYFKSKFPNLKIIELNRKLTNSENSITWNQLTTEFNSDVNAYIHLAGMAHDTKNTTLDSVYFEVNTNLTVQLFKNFLASKATQFIYVSSVKAAADTIQTELTEEIIPNPQTAYGKSKYAAELEIQNLYQNYISKNPNSKKKYYILRPCMIHGPGNKGNLNLLVNFTQKGIPYPLAAFQNKRSYLSIFNMVYIIAVLTESDIPNGIYNLADDDKVSTNELIDLISKTINKKIIKLRIPQILIKLIFKLFDIFHFPIGSEHLNKLVENYQVSNTKIKKELGIDLPMTTTKGLEITIHSFNN